MREGRSNEELVRQESRAGRSNEVLVHEDTRESMSNEVLVRRPVDVDRIEIPRTSRYLVLRGKSVEAGSGYRRGGGHRWFEGRHARAPFYFRRQS